MQIGQSLHDAWWRLATQHHPQTFSDTLTCSALQAASLGYRAVVALRNQAYGQGWVQPVRLPCPVVSVGNVTVGGTGKTACVELIAKKLLGLGKQVAVLSRGYGGTRRDYWLRWEAGKLLIDGHEASVDGLADEPQLLARHLERVPILVGARRDQTGRTACEQLGCETLVLDDGFQHRCLARDCDIVLIHARMPLGGAALLPRGPMREPISSLRRAHVLIITKADEALELLGALGERLRALNPDAVLATAVHEPVGVEEPLRGIVHEAARLAGMRVGLVSSIGDPEGFDSTVRRLGATVVWHRSFPDHYPYRQSDIDSVRQEADRTRPDAVLTTEKDWVRLRSWSVPWWVLRIQMKLLSGEAELDARLAGLCAR